MRVDGWFNLVRADGSQPSRFPRDDARERRSVYVFGALCAVGLIALLIVTPPAPVAFVLVPALVTGVLSSVLQGFRLRDQTKPRR